MDKAGNPAVKCELGPDVPLHFSHLDPEYLLKNLPSTPVETLERAKAIADAEGLHYVYIGNVPGRPAESTYCPHCRKKVVDRTVWAIPRTGWKTTGRTQKSRPARWVRSSVA